MKSKCKNIVTVRCGTIGDKVFYITAIVMLLFAIIFVVYLSFYYKFPLLLICDIGFVLILFFILTYRPILFVFRKIVIDLDNCQLIAFPVKGLIGKQFQKKTIIDINKVVSIKFYYSYFDANKKRIPDCDSPTRVMYTDAAFFAADFVLTDGEIKKVMLHHLSKQQIGDIKSYIKLINTNISMTTDMTKIH